MVIFLSLLIMNFVHCKKSTYQCFMTDYHELFNNFQKISEMYFFALNPKMFEKNHIFEKNDQIID